MKPLNMRGTTTRTATPPPSTRAVAMLDGVGRHSLVWEARKGPGMRGNRAGRRPEDLLARIADGSQRVAEMLITWQRGQPREG